MYDVLKCTFLYRNPQESKVFAANSGVVGGGVEVKSIQKLEVLMDAMDGVPKVSITFYIDDGKGSTLTKVIDIEKASLLLHLVEPIQLTNGCSITDG